MSDFKILPKVKCLEIADQFSVTSAFSVPLVCIREIQMSFWSFLSATSSELSAQSRLIDIDKQSNLLIEKAWLSHTPIVAPKAKKMIFDIIKRSEYLNYIGEKDSVLDKYVNEHDLAVRKMTAYLEIYRDDPLMPRHYDLVHNALKRLITIIDKDAVNPTMIMRLYSLGISPI